MDGVPFILTVIGVWAKVVHATLILPAEHRSGAGGSLDALRALLWSPVVGLGTLAMLLAILAPLVLLPRAWRLLGLLVVNAAITVLAMTDLVHVRFYGDIGSVDTFVLAPTLLEFMPTVTSLLESGDVFYVVDLLLVAIFVLVYGRLRGPGPPVPFRARRRLAVGALAAAGAVAVLPIGMVWRAREDLFASTAVRIDTAASVGILPYHAAETALRLIRRNHVATEGDIERVLVHLNPPRRYPPSVLTGVARGRNVIVMSAESLQAFTLGLEIRGQRVTPNLSAFARESLNFVNIYDQTHLGTTADAEFMVMQSLYPLPASVVASDYNGNRFRGVPALLADRGYTTLSACAAPGYFWDMARMHARFGFQRFYYEDRYPAGERIGPWLADGAFFGETVRILATQPEPFMAFMLSASNHHPYQLPERHKRLRLGPVEGTVLGDYLHTVHYFDAAFGQFVAGLRRTGMLDRTVMLVYGDHQGFLGDPPALAEMLGYSQSDRYRRLTTRKKVPLLIRLPRAEFAGVRTVTGGHVDVAPTLLSLLGVDADSSVMLGQDLTRGRDAVVVFRDGSFVDGTHHLTRQVGGIGRYVCYEVKTGRVVDCAPLKERHRTARERLEVSDTIIRGDLIPDLATRSRVGLSR